MRLMEGSPYFIPMRFPDQPLHCGLLLASPLALRHHQAETLHGGLPVIRRRLHYTQLWQPRATILTVNSWLGRKCDRSIMACAPIMSGYRSVLSPCQPISSDRTRPWLHLPDPQLERTPMGSICVHSFADRSDHRCPRYFHFYTALCKISKQTVKRDSLKTETYFLTYSNLVII